MIRILICADFEPLQYVPTTFLAAVKSTLEPDFYLDLAKHTVTSLTLYQNLRNDSFYQGTSVNNTYRYNITLGSHKEPHSNGKSRFKAPLWKPEPVLACARVSYN